MVVDLAADSGVDRPDVVAALTSVAFSHSGSFLHRENFRHRNGEPVQVANEPAMDRAVRRAGGDHHR